MNGTSKTHYYGGCTIENRSEHVGGESVENPLFKFERTAKNNFLANWLSWYKMTGGDALIIDQVPISQ